MLPILSLSFSVHSLTPELSFLISSFFTIVSISPDCFPFYYLQFLSSLPQYSWLYLLSDHPNSFLAVNLSGKSLLLNVLSLRSCLAMSSISHQYSFSNSLIASFMFSKFSLSSQVSDSAVNPFQHTKYLSFSLTRRLFKILSTFHSSFPSIITRASCSSFLPLYLPYVSMYSTNIDYWMYFDCAR